MSVITEKKVTIELESSCTCTDEQGNWLGECFGCWQDNLEYFNELFEEWKQVVAFDENNDVVWIEGTAMGWQRRSGYAVVPQNKVIDALSINGDYRLAITFDNDNFTCVRYSHDEPTGASFTMTKHTSEEE